MCYGWLSVIKGTALEVVETFNQRKRSVENHTAVVFQLDCLDHQEMMTRYCPVIPSAKTLLTKAIPTAPTPLWIYHPVLQNHQKMPARYFPVVPSAESAETPFTNAPATTLYPLWIVT